MSEESLRRLLEQLNGDAAFLERLKANPRETLAGFDLSLAEQTALATNDDDGLRRLAGQDVAGFNSPAASRGLHAGLLNQLCAQPIVTLPTQCFPIDDGSIQIECGPSALGSG
jgi:hypothetical protein